MAIFKARFINGPHTSAHKSPTTTTSEAEPASMEKSLDAGSVGSGWRWGSDPVLQELSKRMKAEIGETRDWGSGKKYKKEAPGVWKPIGKTEHPGGGSGGDAGKKKPGEKEAVTASQLHDKFMDVLADMTDNGRTLFRGGKFEADKKRFVSNNGKWALQYEGGEVGVVSLKKALRIVSWLDKARKGEEKAGHKYVRRTKTAQGWQYKYAEAEGRGGAAPSYKDSDLERFRAKGMKSDKLAHVYNIMDTVGLKRPTFIDPMKYGYRFPVSGEKNEVTKLVTTIKNKTGIEVSARERRGHGMRAGAFDLIIPFYEGGVRKSAQHILVLGKAGTHKYIERKGTKGNYQYRYADDKSKGLGGGKHVSDPKSDRDRFNAGVEQRSREDAAAREHLEHAIANEKFKIKGVQREIDSATEKRQPERLKSMTRLKQNMEKQLASLEATHRERYRKPSIDEPVEKTRSLSPSMKERLDSGHAVTIQTYNHHEARQVKDAARAAGHSIKGIGMSFTIIPKAPAPAESVPPTPEPGPVAKPRAARDPLKPKNNRAVQKQWEKREAEAKAVRDRKREAENRLTGGRGFTSYSPAVDWHGFNQHLSYAKAKDGSLVRVSHADG